MGQKAGILTAPWEKIEHISKSNAWYRWDEEINVVVTLI